jgi:hypothetical protein
MIMDGKFCTLMVARKEFPCSLMNELTNTPKYGTRQKRRQTNPAVGPSKQSAWAARRLWTSNSRRPSVGGGNTLQTQAGEL